jgi:DHA2 family multidrug resistance protein-like MFS transporter
MVAGSVVAPRLAQRFRTSHVIAAGLVISAAGFLVLTLVRADNGLPLLISGLVLAALGMGLPMSLTGNMVMASAPPEKAGSAAAVMETSGEFGVAVGIATLGSLATYVYRSQVADGVPAGVPADVASAVNESLADAVGAVQQTSGQLGTELLRLAQSAFTSGLNAVSVVGVVVFVVLAALCVLVLRKADAPAIDESAVAEVSATMNTDRAVPVGAPRPVAEEI